MRPRGMRGCAWSTDGVAPKAYGRAAAGRAADGWGGGLLGYWRVEKTGRMRAAHA